MPFRGLRLARYVSRLVLVRAAGAAAVLTAMYVLVDGVESASFAGASPARVAALYLFKLPAVAVHVAPVAAALATVLALGALVRRGELDAAAAAGLGPGFLVCGLVAVPCALSALLLPTAHVLAPRALSRFERGLSPGGAPREPATDRRWVRLGSAFALVDGSGGESDRPVVLIDRREDGRAASWSGPCGPGGERCRWTSDGGWLPPGSGLPPSLPAIGAVREPPPSAFGIVGASLTSGELRALSSRLEARGRPSTALRAELALRNAIAAACVIVPALSLLLALGTGTSRDTRLVGIAVASAAAYWLALSLAWNAALSGAISPGWIDAGVPAAFGAAIAVAAGAKAATGLLRS